MARPENSWNGAMLAGGLGLALLTAPTAEASRPEPLPGTQFIRLHTVDALKRDITYYVSEGKPGAPILLMIQGSGCVPVFIDDGRGHYGSTVFGAMTFAYERQFTVVVVEKPFATNPGGDRGGGAEACGDAFNLDFTAERWRVALEAALKAAREAPDGHDRSRTLIFGQSEGAVMAALMAGHDASITDVVGVGMSGSSQLFDFTALTYAEPGTASDHVAALDALDAEVKAINAKPDSITDFVWGHPFRRWSSFFKVSAADELLKSHARVYLVSGTADQAVTILSTEIAFTTLRAHGRDVTIRRVAGADHALKALPDQQWTQTSAEYSRAIQWFWSRPKDGPH
jgi:predicted esterase